ncbi:MAG: hypothetical protein JXX29_00845 [Deltaproteobacteria bacterium]|nr:hypothetical protein [Deltaproteobacteria bacterium]MBN2670185.1 hypothetical protein [Deltaproteobacteria bacterium]
MNFKCPQCETGYEMPQSLLPKPGIDGVPAKLRCVRCKCVFVMAAEAASPGETADGRKDVYFELISPNAIHGAEFGFPTADVDRSAHRVKYQVQALTAGASAGEIVTDASSWNPERTLDLSDYEIQSFQRAAKWKARTAGFIAALILGTVVYIAGMNDWSISVNNWKQDVKRAFFLQSDAEIESELLLKMTVTLQKGYTVKPKKGRMVGVINGEIQNNSSIDVAHVMLEGRLLDATKKIVRTVDVPCAVVVPDGKIRSTAAKNLNTLYQREGVIENCEIQSGFSQKFKVIFDDLPEYFNSTYRFEVHPKSLQPKKTK